jgi:hypothetical protein
MKRLSVDFRYSSGQADMFDFTMGKIIYNGNGKKIMNLFTLFAKTAIIYCDKNNLRGVMK